MFREKFEKELECQSYRKSNTIRTLCASNCAHGENSLSAISIYVFTVEIHTAASSAFSLHNFEFDANAVRTNCVSEHLNCNTCAFHSNSLNSHLALYAMMAGDRCI